MRELKKSGKFILPKFGTFIVHTAGKALNPRSGEPIKGEGPQDDPARGVAQSKAGSVDGLGCRQRVCSNSAGLPEVLSSALACSSGSISWSDSGGSRSTSSRLISNCSIQVRT